MDETAKRVTKLNVNEFVSNRDNIITLTQYLQMCSKDFSNSKKTTIIPSIVIDGEYDIGSELHEFNDISEFDRLFDTLIDTYNCFIFSGESGIGKSMFLRKLVECFSREYQDGVSNYVPIYLDCKDYPGGGVTLESWIASILREKYAGFDYFQCGKEEDYYIIFIDSINKIKSSGYDDFREQIEQWSNWMSELIDKNIKIKFVIASEKIPFVVGVNSYFKRSFDLAQFYLQPLTNKQIEYLIDNSQLLNADKLKMKNDIFERYASLSFIHLPFYVDKLIKASRVVTNLRNKTMFIEYLLRLTFDGAKYKRTEIDTLLQMAAFISANNNKFSISDFDEVSVVNTLELIQFCVNSSILVHDDINDEYSFSHQIFHYYYLGLYLKNHSLSCEWDIKKLMVCNSRLDNIEPIKHLFNLISETQRRSFFEFLIENDLLIAANCIVELTSYSDWKLEIVHRILRVLSDKNRNAVSPEERKSFGLLLGLLGDHRFSIANNVIEPQVVRCGDNLFVSIYPVTNLEYAKFLSDPDHLNEYYWRRATSDSWFDSTVIVNCVLEHWRNVQEHLRKSIDSVKTICGKNRFNKEQCACLFYFLEMNNNELKHMINELYGNNTPIPLMWRNPEYNNPSMPVVGISIYEAMAYCEWLSHRTSKKYRLLTSKEWFEASGGKKRNFPYGNKFEQSYVNTIDSEWDSILAVGIIPQNITSTGIYDMSGNIFEWTSSIWSPTSIDDKSECCAGLDTQYVCRGGSWIQGEDRAILSYIGRGKGWVKNIDIGFRICYEY